MKAIYTIIILFVLPHLGNAQLNEVLLPSQTNTQRAQFVNEKSLDNASSWEIFRENYGNWFVSFDKATKTPHRAMGPSIKIDGYDLITNENIEQAAMSFLNQNAELFRINTNELRLIRAVEKNNRWYVSFHQFKGEKEVLNSEVELRIFKNAKVMAFGVEFYNDIDTNAQAKISLRKAIELASGQKTKEKTEVINSDEAEKLYILPVKFNSKLTYKLVYKLEFKNSGDFRTYLSYVDAVDGELLYRRQLTNNFSNKITTVGDVYIQKYQDETVTKAFPYQTYDINGEKYTADENGVLEFDINDDTEVKTSFEGTYCKVTFDGANSSEDTFNIQSGEEFSMEWNDENSNFYERFAFYHTNIAYKWIKNIDPELTSIDIQMSIDFQKNSQGGANAYSNRDEIVFLQYQDENTMIGRSPSVLYHEYGHSINSLFFIDQRGNDMESRASHEALADLTAALILDNPKVGEGVFADSLDKVIRTLENDYVYPDDMVGESHHDGQILAGAFWDLRKLTSIELVARLSHYARYGLPDDPNDGVAFKEWFVEVLVADDDDGDLSNGTPNFNEIVEAFNRHNIGTNLLLAQGFSHTVHPNTEIIDQPYVINFEIIQNTLANLETENVKIVYSYDSFQTSAEAMAIEVNDGQFTVEIPATNNSEHIQYYISFEDNLTESDYKFPMGEKNYSFLAGYQTVYKEDFENADDWLMNEDNDAASGAWEIAEPNQVDMSMFGMDLILQPEEDHSEEGTKCLVTDSETGFMMNFIQHCVTGGQVLAVSPQIEVPNNGNSLIQLYSWFAYISQTAGENEELFFRIDYSIDNGETWEELYKTQESKDEWQQIILMIPEEAAGAGNIKLRFVAKNPEGGQMPNTLAEALIDDISILSPVSSSTDIDDVISENNVYAYPNPFKTKAYIELNLENTQNLQIDLYDVLGNKVQSLANKLMPAGNHKIEIDGSNLDNGVYFYHIHGQNINFTDKVILNK